MKHLVPALEALAGSVIHRLTIDQLIESAEGPGAQMLRAVVRNRSRTIAQALGDDAGLLTWTARAPRSARREVERTLLTWASEIGVTKTVGPPPEAPIMVYARERGLLERLDDPIEVLEHLVDREAYWMLRRGGLGEGRLRHLIPRSSNWPVLQGYFDYCVRRREAVERRAQLWTHPAVTPALDALASRLSERLAALQIVEPPRPVRTVETTPRIDDDGLALVMEDRGTYPVSAAHVSLVKGDAGGAIVSTNLLPGHPLVRVTLERALDAVFDTADPLHAPLRHALETPRWERLLVALQRTVAVEDGSQGRHDAPRLVWRVEVDGRGRVDVHAAVQKRTARGTFSRGKHVPLERIRHSGAMLDESDERVLASAAPRPFSVFVQPALQDRRGAMLEALAGHPRLLVENTPGRVVVRAPELVIEEDADELSLHLRVGASLLSPDEAKAALIGKSHIVRVHAGSSEVEVSPVEPALVELLDAASRYATRVPRRVSDALLAVLARLPAGVGLELPPSMAGDARAAIARPLVRAEPLPGGGLRVQVYVRPLGAGPVHRPGEGPTHIVAVLDGVRVHTQRDLAAERHAHDALLSAGLDAAFAEGRHTLRFDTPDDALGFLEALGEQPDLATLEWPDEALAWQVSRAKKFDLGLRRAEHWFEADARIDVDDAQVTLATLLLALREGRRFVAVGKGRFARITSELRAQLASIDPIVHLRGQTARIAPSAAALVEAALPGDRITGDQAWRALAKRLRASAKAKPRLPEELDATLRDYQHEGVTWLLRTASWAEGACLADEMGLGKTVQALALLLARRDEGPSLVVCPTSLSDNWVAECARFAGRGLRAHLYRGADRARVLETLGPGDLLMASYDVVARDREALAAITFSTLVIDEAQAIKNPAALRTQAIRELRAGFRLALTGTPIENRLSELYSLFTVLAPGLLGSWDEFRARFAVPIEKQGDAQRLAQLREIVRPFLLRRTKGMVARELPARTEIIRPVELGDEERALYEAQRQRALAMLEARREDKDFRFALLAELTRLRRLVCHPALVVPESTAPSSKLEELFGLVDDLRREDHRALVFSQFTSLLAFVCAGLDARRIPYLYLDGSTPAPERAKLVGRWQEGDAPIFLISLKAGGTGLNLTAADYVVHLDPWWNPAVEDQASDRAHRIGQTKPVTVVRLVAQGTIEERVLAMHEDKRRLASGVLEGAETNATLEPDDLLALLGDGESLAKGATPKTKKPRARRG